MGIVEIPSWLLPTLNGLLMLAVGWSFTRQQKRDDAMAVMREEMANLRLMVAKEYFSADQAATLTRKLDQVIDAMHTQSLVLTEVKTELRATRNAAQMTASAAVHPGGHQ